jgi:hypothetical protein
MYTRDAGTVNGTVFRWVPPDSTTGRPRGDYAPVRVLVPPKLLQVLDMIVDYRISDKITMYSEGAVSSNDQNRFSPLDDRDNADLATKSGIRVDRLKLTDSLQLRLDASHRWVGKNYANLDRVYKIEYGREWNFNDQGERLDESVSEGILELRYGNGVRFLSNAGIRAYGTRLFSVKQLYELESSHKWVQGKYTFTSVSTQDRIDATFSRWMRHNGDLHKDIWKLRPGVEIWLEDKTQTIHGMGQDGAFRFTDLKPYLRTIKSEKLDLSLMYNYRGEWEQLDAAFRPKSIAHTESMKLIWAPTSLISLQNTSSLRNFQVRDSKFLERGLLNSQTLMSNFQGSWYTKNRVMFSNLLYEVTSEQVARRQVAYVEVYPGQGEYEWIDADSNGVQSLDEFQYSTNPNRSNFYVRILIPSTQLFPVTSLNFMGNLKVDLKKAWKRTENPLLETIRNMSAATNFRVAQKKDAANELRMYLVNVRNVFADTSLLDAQYTFRQDLYFFRNDPLGDLKFSYADNKSKQFLVSGDETRSLRFWGGEQRLNFGKSKSLENEVQMGTKQSSAVKFDSRAFRIRYLEVKPHVNLQLSRKLRLTTGYEFKRKVNSNDSLVQDAKVNLHKVSLDAKWNLKDRNNIFARLDLVKVGQTGNASFSALYEMRESLQPGFNAIWQVFSTIYLSKTLELGLTYDGRAAEGNNILHTGRIQLKAFF